MVCMYDQGMAATTTYRIAPAPRFAGMRTWDCAECGCEEVRPVFLEGPSTTIAVGSGCAARLLGYPARAARRVRDEAAAIQAAADAIEARRIELAEAAAAGLAAFRAGDDAGAERMRRAYIALRKSGKLADPAETFPAFMVRVAETGAP